MENNYYILSIGQINLLEHSEIVETAATIRKSLNDSQFVCKTLEGITNTPAFLNPATAMSHDEIKVEMAKPKWSSEIDV
jgi:hypothetical protein